MTEQQSLENKLEQKANAVAKTGNKKPVSKGESIRQALEKYKGQIAMALPKHITPDRLTRIAMTSIRTNPKLMSCEMSSLLSAVIQAAQVGLEPGIMGQCYLVPYGTQAQFIIGYKGLIDLVRRSGHITSIAAHAVYENDEFDFEYGLNEKLHHKQNLDNKGELKAFYAYAKFKDGGHAFEVMSKEDIDRIRDKYSKSQKNGTFYGPWKDEYEEMGKKTVVKKLIKYLPISIEILKQFNQDETVKKNVNEVLEPYNEVDFIEVETTEPSVV